MVLDFESNWCILKEWGVDGATQIADKHGRRNQSNELRVYNT